MVEPGAPEALREALASAEAVLVVGDRRRSPRTALPGPFLEDPSGRPVPAGWLPNLGEELDVFARAAARVERRDGPAGPVAVLGQRERRYLRLAGRMEAKLGGAGAEPLQLLRWTSERITPRRSRSWAAAGDSVLASTSGTGARAAGPPTTASVHGI